jgi:HSP20 family protein
MAEKGTTITPTRGEQSRRMGRPLGSSASPFTTVQRFADEMDRLFDNFGLPSRWASPFRWGTASAARWGTGFEDWTPDVEVFQKDDQLTIRADLPGLRKDEVSVDLTDTTLTIQGERKREHDEQREGVYRSERSYGSFCRMVALPEGAMTDQAKANFRDGVLEITMPTPPVAKGRRLEISEGSTT